MKQIKCLYLYEQLQRGANIEHIDMAIFQMHSSAFEIKDSKVHLFDCDFDMAILSFLVFFPCDVAYQKMY